MKSTNVLIRALFDKKLRVLWHVLFWVFIYLDEFFSLVGITPELESPQDFFINLACNAAVVYLNLYILRPYFLKHKRVLIYIFASVACVFLIIYLDELIYDYDIEAEYVLSSFVSNFGFNTFLLAIPIFIKTVKEAWSNQIKDEQILAEKLNLELAYLKNQINPHFLFNTLNSLYIQSKKNSGNVSEALLSFSELLRYQLYDCQKDQVNLDKEIEYLQNYLDLEKTRRDHLDIRFEKEIDRPHLKIEPLLFLPLVENAVKYSMTNGLQKSFIHIKAIQEGSSIEFNISNNIGFENNEKNPHSGIGLSNLKRRLELYYPDQHALTIEKSESKFTALLNLDLKK